MYGLIDKPRIGLDRIVNLFDDLQPGLLSCFDVYLHNKPDPLTIKDFFKTYYKTAVCRYYVDEENDLIAHFANIVYNNIDLISKMRYIAGDDGRKYNETIDKLKDLDVFSDVQTFVSKNTVGGKNVLEGNIDLSKEDNLLSGSLQGTADVTQLTSLMEETNTVVEAKKILDKSQDKYLDYLDPNVKTTSHVIDVTKNKFKSQQKTNDTNTYNSISQLENKAMGGRVIQDVILMLNLEIPKIRNIFLSKFNELFWL